ncbi:hypothetical protein WFZ85_10320 [Flavobacterium sp. j3]|uniref:Tissue inhibitor of metalloproteinase n=1 Tax=Flavobacterium aureirubrum TaxID=3133147 RepID=A0ABU9N5M3_9FLAO
MKKIIVFILLILFVSNKSYGCSCSEKPSIKYNFSEADQIFIGKIIKIDGSNYDESGQKINFYTVEILESFKDDFYKLTKRKFRTIVSSNVGSCDYNFILGKVYLIYANSSNDLLSCSMCSRTELIDRIKKSELEELKKLKIEAEKEENQIKIVAFKNKFEKEKDLMKGSFDKKSKDYEMIIYSLSGLLILLLILLLKKNRKLRS